MEHSESIINLAKALVAFQGKVKDPAKDKDNPFFKSKYVGLDSLLDAVRPVLSECGLGFIQSPSGNGQDISITTLLMHTSGEWLQSDPFTLRATKNDAQGTGSAVTYARRYSLSSILGVAWDDDDDANGCISKTGKAAQNGNQTQKSTAPQTVSDYYQLVTTYARKNKAVGYIVAILKDSFNKTKFSELSLTEAKTFYDHMEELIKKQYELSAKDDAALMDGVG
jgi:hypothetical protein